jgi:hypothetical protein
MKKLLLTPIILIILVGTAFAVDFVKFSKGQVIYTNAVHYSSPQGSSPFVQAITRLQVNNFEGLVEIEYIDWYGIDYSGTPLDPVRVVENFELPPWKTWAWVTPVLVGPPGPIAPTNFASPYFIIKWVSKDNKRISSPLFFGTSVFLENYQLKFAAPIMNIAILRDEK